VNVASERQIAANCQNARKSTGPRSIATKKRVAQNAYRHGLSVSSGSLATFTKRLNRLTRKIVGNTSDEMILEQARIVAQAELDLARVRWAKVALIERVAACENLQPSQLLGRDRLKAIQRLNMLRQPIESATIMAPEKRDQSAEAIRRVLPQLLKLNRYERRAAARRDRAIHCLWDWQNEANFPSLIQQVVRATFPN
jgi:hypothetical protein